jgi:hypothetical protein
MPNITKLPTMNKKTVLFLFGLLAFGLWALPISLHAQTSAPLVADQPPAIVVTAETVATPFIVSFAQAHPWLATVLTVMAAIGSVAKPIMTGIEITVQNFPPEEEELQKAEASTAFKIVAWLLDFFTRIKIGPQFKATPPKS